MKNERFLISTVMAGLMGLASAAAMAQKPADVPANGAEPATRATVRAEAQAANRAKTIPNGETSTLIDKKPNATPQTSEMTRGEVKQTARHQKRPFGNTGERPTVPTNPTDSTGTPK